MIASQLHDSRPRLLTLAIAAASSVMSRFAANLALVTRREKTTLAPVLSRTPPLHFFSSQIRASRTRPLYSRLARLNRALPIAPCVHPSLPARRLSRCLSLALRVLVLSFCRTTTADLVFGPSLPFRHESHSPECLAWQLLQTSDLKIRPLWQSEDQPTSPDQWRITKCGTSA